ncbi:MAG: KUP/HAK/KT family potassium transporter [Bauldia sp.]|nr:KUP/HAK/KT family potassium transporter [Bauldia sp.]
MVSTANGHGTAHRGAAVLAALGIVYGDIGTSPLYAFREAVHAGAGSGLSAEESVFGVLSLITWALILVISIKYCIFILKADNRGEGGILALIALVNPARFARRWQYPVVAVGLVGAALLYADGAITPAISILSAAEGVAVYAPGLQSAIVPLTTVVIVLLFLMQRQGTARISRVFGPVILIWFLVIGILGLVSIVGMPGVLRALGPHYALRFLFDEGGTSLAIIGAVFLVVTGGEALYADMGHVGRRPIRITWFAVVLPALLLNYFGQGALVLAQPDAIENPFYRLAPEWAHWPMIALATAAAIIASQAIISGAFSLTQQAVNLGFLPRMRIVHTAGEMRGQIYVPFVNWLLLAATLAAVWGFGTSSALAGAYGVAISALMAITTILASLVALRWGYPKAVVYAIAAAILFVDLSFAIATFTKIAVGGWFPIVGAVGIVLLMLTWRTGRRLLQVARDKQRMPTADFVAKLAEKGGIVRVPGTALFLSTATAAIPRILIRHLKLNHSLHEEVFVVSVTTVETPRVDYDSRIAVEEVSPGIRRITLRFGFMETPDVPWALIAATAAGRCPELDPGEVTYFVGRETVVPTPGGGMAPWRERLFSFMSRNAQMSAAHFHLPLAQVIEVGIPLEI